MNNQKTRSTESNRSNATEGKDTDWSKTLNLPQTDFPMKADLTRREPEIQKYWDEIQLYKLSLEKRAPRGPFVLHDGPPYSNGNIHIGTALQNKVPKDVTTRYRTLRGYYAPFVPGWDNHGMPIENAVSLEFRKKKIEPTRLELRRACREYASKWVDIQRQQFIRLGIRGEWDAPYLTMDPAYEARLVEVFGELLARNFVYRGLRPIHWCPNDRTAVAGAEIEYDEEHVSTSIYVRFKVSADPNGAFGAADPDHCYTIIWTTTPWTIPANVAVAVNAHLEYVVVKVGDDRYLLSEGLAARSLASCGLVDTPEGRDLDSVTLEELGVPVLSRFHGSELEGLKFHHPLVTRQSVLVMGDHVNLEAGTGVVHIAPGHGVEDFVIGQRYSLPALCPVDERGVFTEEAGQFAGMHIEPGNRAVVDALQAAGALLKEEPYQHSYPMCWRCHGPVIFRATVQWFMNLDHAGHRQKCLTAIDELVTWHPPEAAGRIRAYITNRPDWCLSRQRSWGVGIPVIYCDCCNNPVSSEEAISRIAEAIRQSDSDAWYEKDVMEFLPEGTTCSQCGCSEFRKETDTLSVWFDSGSSCRAVLDVHHGLSYPAALYMEGYDQLRAWFNESLMIGMATRGRPPYREVVAHGFTVDEHGLKMSKNKGNVINPMTLMETYGADILRWMAMSFDYWEDMRLGETTLKQYAEQYRDIRNRFRFMLGNLHDFMPGLDSVSPAQMEEVDRWILHRVQRLVERVTAAYESYQYHNVTREVFQFLSSDLSAFYLDVVKDRVYTSLPNSPGRRSAQTAIHELTRCLAVILSPILVHTMEEIWSHLPGGRDELCSVHLCDFPVVRTAYLDDDLAARWQPVFEVRKEVQRVLDASRRDGSLKNTREAAITLHASSSLARQLEPFGPDLPTILLVSEVTVVGDGKDDGLEIEVVRADGLKCGRCWNVRPTVGEDSDYPDLCNHCAPAVRNWPIYS